MVPQAAVAGVPRGGPERVSLWVGLPLWVVDAARTAEGPQASLLWAVDAALVEGHLMGAAGAGGGPGRGVSPPGGALGVWATPLPREGGAVGA